MIRQTEAQTLEHSQSNLAVLMYSIGYHSQSLLKKQEVDLGEFFYSTSTGKYQSKNAISVFELSMENGHGEELNHVAISTASCGGKST